MESITVEYISDYLEDNYLLPNKQVGFRTGCVTVEQLLVYSDVAKWVDSGKTVDTVYLD